MNATSAMASAVASAMPVELQLPHIVAGGKHLSYYVAVASVLLVAWFFQSRKQSQIDVPFYKAGKTKWLFGAEGLILESYNKVRPFAECFRGRFGVADETSSGIVCIRSRLPRASRSSSPPSSCRSSRGCRRMSSARRKL